MSSRAAVRDDYAEGSRRQEGTEMLSFDRAASEFLDYLRSYRDFSPSTVRAYAGDLRVFQEFLASRYGPIEYPNQVRREMVVQFGVYLKGAAALTVKRKLARLSSFCRFLQDTGCLIANPARGAPLRKAAQPVPVCLTEEQARRLLEACHVPHQRDTYRAPLFSTDCGYYWATWNLSVASSKTRWVRALTDPGSTLISRSGL